MNEPALGRFIRACFQHFWVVVAGFALTVIAVHLVSQSTGVYYAETRVRLVRAPVSYANPLTDSGEIVAATGVLQRIVGGIPGPATVSLDVTLADKGVRDGQSVQIRNDGGQWNNWYDKPELLVEAVGPSRGQVAERMFRLLAQIDADLATMQSQKHVRPKDLISTQRIPSQVSVFYVGGKPKQAMAVTGMLGVALTAVAVNLVDGSGWFRRRRVAVRRAGVVRQHGVTTT